MGEVIPFRLRSHSTWNTNPFVFPFLVGLAHCALWGMVLTGWWYFGVE